MSMRCFSRRLRFEPLETRRLLATFTVTNTLDLGAGSLRQAILDANAASEASLIAFQIPASDPNFIDVDSAVSGGDAEPDVWRIQPLTELPELTASVAVTIDGQTQTAFGGNLNPLGPEIVLDGDGLLARGLTIRTNDHTIRGLNIQDFGRSGIDLFGGDRVVIIGNYIGVDATGTVAAGNGRWGINVNGDADENRIGTDADTIGDAFERNIISGNGFDGIGITGAGNDFNIVAGNYIGTNATGTAKIPNLQDGVEISGGGQFNRIGANPSGINQAVEANLISGNTFSGVSLSGANTLLNEVAGNLIGTDVSGASALGNSQSGVILSGGANQNIVGGSSPLARNVISGNTLSGVSVRGVGTSENRIRANYIGINRAGTAAIANGNRGVVIDTGAAKNVIGTDGNGINDAASGNVISGNLQSGISIQDVGSDENIVAGNLIGTNAAGTAAIANGNRGVAIFDGAKRNRIGTNGDGTSDLLERNLLSGNMWEGVGISEVETSLNVVAGNFIGTDVTGTLDIGNGFRGVAIFLGASLNIIGGGKPELRNLISGNDTGGINITTGATQNHVAGNYIGTDVTGNLALPNTFTGVRLGNGATGNIIGTNADGTADEFEGNLIAANTEYGVLMTDAGTANNTVAGNLIGTDVTGTADLGNGLRGVAIEAGAGFARIGGTSAAARNVISGNGTGGIRITGSGLPGGTGNVVIGNYIGTDITGSAAIANSDFGVLLEAGSPGNRIGTDGDGVNDAAEGNLISGNNNSGIRIVGPGTFQNIVAGNQIGTNADGTADLGNTGHGVSIGTGAANNRVGTNGDGISDALERNLISGNNNRGVRLTDAGTTGNVVAGNYIGVNAEATAAIGNTFDGVLIELGAAANQIGTDGDGQGDAAERNIISGNLGVGVNIVGAGTSLNVVAGNSIGTDASGAADLGNTMDGVRFQNAAENNAVVGNIIAFNSQNGVELTTTAGRGNAILANSIHTNALFGIDLNADQITPNDDQDADEGPNRLQNTPEIVGAILGPSGMRVTYSVPTALANASYPLRVEFFLADEDSHEGQTFLGADVFTAADFLAGSKSVTLALAAPVTAGQQIVATATDSPATGPGGNTSEFSVDVTVGSNPWHNVDKPLNVDGDVGVFAADALDVINFLNAFGSVPVPDNGTAPPFLDTNGDFFVSAGDALDIINFLNAGLGGEGEAGGDEKAVDAVFGSLEMAGTRSLGTRTAETIYLASLASEGFAGRGVRRIRRV